MSNDLVNWEQSPQIEMCAVLKLTFYGHWRSIWVITRLSALNNFSWYYPGTWRKFLLCQHWFVSVPLKHIFGQTWWLCWTVIIVVLVTVCAYSTSKIKFISERNCYLNFFNCLCICIFKYRFRHKLVGQFRK